MMEDRDLRLSLARSALVLGVVLMLSRHHGTDWILIQAGSYLLWMISVLFMEAGRNREKREGPGRWPRSVALWGRIFEFLTRRDMRVTGCLVIFGIEVLRENVILMGGWDFPLESGSGPLETACAALAVLLTVLAGARDGELVARALRRHGWRVPLVVSGGRGRRKERAEYWVGGSVNAMACEAPAARLELEASLIWSLILSGIAFTALAPAGPQEALVHLAVVYLVAAAAAQGARWTLAWTRAARPRLNRWFGELVELSGHWDIRPLAAPVALGALVAVAAMMADVVAILEARPPPTENADKEALMRAQMDSRLWLSAWSAAVHDADRAYAFLVNGMPVLVAFSGWHDSMWRAAAVSETGSSDWRAWRRRQRDMRWRRWLRLGPEPEGAGHA